MKLGVMRPQSTFNETAINIVAEGTRIEGQMTFNDVSRIHGVLVGQVHALEGSTLILSETAVVEGSIHADTLIIDGYVQGDIIAKTRTVITRTGRVIGNIKTPSMTLEFGAYLEGRCTMNLEKPSTSNQTEKPVESP